MILTKNEEVNCVFHLDADEVFTPDLKREIDELLSKTSHVIVSPNPAAHFLKVTIRASPPHLGHWKFLVGHWIFIFPVNLICIPSPDIQLPQTK